MSLTSPLIDQALAQVCAFHLPLYVLMAIYRQLTAESDAALACFLPS